VKAGQSTAEPIIGVDIYPTFLDLAKAKRPDQPMDGRSILPLIRGEAKSVGPRPLFWHFPAYLQAYKVTGEQRDPLFRTRPCSAVRLGDWKLHEYFEDGALELYNLKDDIGERRNLAKANPSKVKELHNLLAAWRKEIAAPVPTKANPDFDAAAEANAIRKALAKGG
jgi:arylsulfatase A-like enzyme